MLNPAQRRALRAACHTTLDGFATPSPAEEHALVAAWCLAEGIGHDLYGEGGAVERFEAKVASVLGKEAAVFMPSGTMAQLCALKVHAEVARLPRFGMHSTCHLLLHEQNAYAEVMHLQAVVLGAAHRPLDERDLASCAQPLSSVVVELPLREAGGLLPEWPALQAMKDWAEKSGVALHMDGARLWECAAWYDKTHAEIAAGFDSVYVSTYKGLGGPAGALLAGSAPFIAQARVWRKRMGGTLYHLGPLVASAAMRFDERLALMPALYRRTVHLAQALAHVEGLRVQPAVPQVNMLHLHFDVEHEKLIAARDVVAQADGVWLFGGAQTSATPGWSVVEMYIGDRLLLVEDARVVALYEGLMAAARA